MFVVFLSFDVYLILNWRSLVEQEKLPTFYWLPKLHKQPYKARFIANSNSCTTTELSKLLTSCLTTIKNHVIKYCEKVYERSGKNLFWSIKNSCEVLSNLKLRGFHASGLSTYDFSTLYTTLPHNLIKDKLVDLIERIFQGEGSLYIACNDRNAFFISDAVRNYNLWSCQKVCEAPTFLLDNICIRFGSKLYRQIVGILVGTNCSPLVANLFLFCYERDFMLSLSEDNQSDVIEAFNSIFWYLDDLLNIDVTSLIAWASLSTLQNFSVRYPGLIFGLTFYLYRMVLLRLKFMINEMILILIL